MLLTTRQVAERLNLSPQTVRKMADSGRLAFTRPSGCHRRFRPSDVEALANPQLKIFEAPKPRFNRATDLKTLVAKARQSQGVRY